MSIRITVRTPMRQTIDDIIATMPCFEILSSFVPPPCLIFWIVCLRIHPAGTEAQIKKSHPDGICIRNASGESYLVPIIHSGEN